MLALWEFFWTEADWLPAPAAPVVVTAARRSNEGGGHRRREYASPHPEFWEVRERYLRRLTKSIEIQESIAFKDVPEAFPEPEAPPESSVVSLDQVRLSRLRQARQELMTRAWQAETRYQLQDLAGQMATLTLDITRQQVNNDHRAIAILLLDFF